MIASNSPPRLHPFLVTSNVKQSSIRFRKPYFVAARKTPGPDASAKQTEQVQVSIIKLRNLYP